MQRTVIFQDPPPIPETTHDFHPACRMEFCPEDPFLADSSRSPCVAENIPRLRFIILYPGKYIPGGFCFRVAEQPRSPEMPLRGKPATRNYFINIFSPVLLEYCWNNPESYRESFEFMEWRRDKKKGKRRHI